MITKTNFIKTCEEDYEKDIKRIKFKIKNSSKTELELEIDNFNDLEKEYKGYLKASLKAFEDEMRFLKNWFLDHIAFERRVEELQTNIKFAKTKLEGFE